MKTPISIEKPNCEASNLRDATLRERRRLPDTRQSITHKFTIGDCDGYVIVGLYDDGRPGELFSTISGFADAVGVLTSLALQHGVPVESLVRKFQYVRFEPSGWTQNDDIRHAHSIVDYVFRWLGLRFSTQYAEEHASAAAAMHEAVPSSA
jgi:ribonucleoside-diphosphate reductase alpha chain